MRLKLTMVNGQEVILLQCCHCTTWQPVSHFQIIGLDRIECFCGLSLLMDLQDDVDSLRRIHGPIKEMELSP